MQTSNRNRVDHRPLIIERPFPRYNPQLPLYTVAWFKIFVDETPVWKGHDFRGMIFGTGNGSLCGGGDGAMGNCTILPPTWAV